MLEKDLKKLRRTELLEIMLDQSYEIDQLRKRVKELEEQLEDRRIKIENAGSIAEASLQLTKVFEEAQKAADLYLENVRNQSKSGVTKKKKPRRKAEDSTEYPVPTDFPTPAGYTGPTIYPAEKGQPIPAEFISGNLEENE
ncbi:MAG: DNA repair protein [Lachnospiraceae bacterium]|nr:DNA repair protein [Lachnospiraceae bacterium]